MLMYFLVVTFFSNAFAEFSSVCNGCSQNCSIIQPSATLPCYQVIHLISHKMFFLKFLICAGKSGGYFKMLFNRSNSCLREQMVMWKLHG